MTYEEYARMRDKMGLTDYAVSNLTNVSRAVFTQWKNGKTKPSKATIERLSSLFDLEDIPPYGKEIKDISKYYDYAVKDIDGVTYVQLTPKEESELKSAIRAFIYGWMMAKRIKEKD